MCIIMYNNFSNNKMTYLIQFINNYKVIIFLNVLTFSIHTSDARVVS